MSPTSKIDAGRSISATAHVGSGILYGLQCAMETVTAATSAKPVRTAQRTVLMLQVAQAAPFHVWRCHAQPYEGRKLQQLRQAINDVEQLNNLRPSHEQSG